MAFKHGDHKHDTVAQAKACDAGEAIPETVTPEDSWRPAEWPTGGCIVRDLPDADYATLAETREYNRSLR